GPVLRQRGAGGEWNRQRNERREAETVKRAHVTLDAGVRPSTTRETGSIRRAASKLCRARKTPLLCDGLRRLQRNGRRARRRPRRFQAANPLQELAPSTVTARRFCDQQEMSLHTATGRSLPYEMVRIRLESMPRDARKER